MYPLSPLKIPIPLIKGSIKDLKGSKNGPFCTQFPYETEPIQGAPALHGINSMVLTRLLSLILKQRNRLRVHAGDFPLKRTFCTALHALGQQVLFAQFNVLLKPLDVHFL